MAPKGRPKASDIFRETDYDFSKKVSFDEAYPTIKNVKAEVLQSGQGVVLRGHPSFYDNYDLKNWPGEFVDCSNPVCYGGGFSIGSILRDMVKKNQAQIKTTKGCRGYEGSPKGRRRYRSCGNRFKIKIYVEYK